MKLTVAEALAALKLTKKKVETRRSGVREAAVRPDMMRDPHESHENGSRGYILSSLQAMQDLGLRHMAIRAAIAKSNAETEISINGRTRTIADWLVWRREVVDDQRRVLLELLGTVEQLRKAGGQFRDQNGNNPVGAVVSVDEPQLREELERLESVLSQLDGKLSVAAATVQIEVPDEVA